FIEFPEGIERDLPNMSVGVGKIAVIASPERLGGLLQDACAGGFCPRHHCVHRVFARQVLCDDDTAIAGPELRGLRVVSLRIVSPQCERGRSGLKNAHAFLACSLRPDEAEPLVERRGLDNVGNAKGDQTDVSGHGNQPSILEKSATVRVVERMRLSSRRRFWRRAGSSVLTVTWSKKASTGARK